MNKQIINNKVSIIFVQIVVLLILILGTKFGHIQLYLMYFCDTLLIVIGLALLITPAKTIDLTKKINIGLLRLIGLLILEAITVHIILWFDYIQLVKFMRH